ncbi:MAG: UDP-3-O-acyl-N-acetylglucosamine deacetylase [Fidelibacterota bacterium]
MNPVQQTIGSPVTVSGTGLHTGVETSITFHPAPENSGIRFIRSDLPGAPEIVADIDRVTDISRGTVLSANGVLVHTVEHVLAAVAGLEIDNIQVELTNKEPPALDGSARGFVEALVKGRILPQRVPRQILEVEEPVRYSEKGSGTSIEVIPSQDFRVTCTLQYEHAVPGYQRMTLKSLNDFAQQIAPARTYCFLSELEDLKQKGLAKGGNLDNALVIADRELGDREVRRLKSLFKTDRELFIGSNGILQGIPLRFENEPVRHKVLDIIGDLALLGQPLKGHVIATRSGHSSHVELVRRIRRVTLSHA